MIRLITDNPEKAQEALGKSGYQVKAHEVIGLVLANKPGILNRISRKFGDAGINISYTYGSGFSDSEAALFIFKVSDLEKALELFPGGNIVSIVGCWVVQHPTSATISTKRGSQDHGAIRFTNSN